jgi:hypothetical protein
MAKTGNFWQILALYKDLKTILHNNCVTTAMHNNYLHTHRRSSFRVFLDGFLNGLTFFPSVKKNYIIEIEAKINAKSSLKADVENLKKDSQKIHSDLEKSFNKLLVEDGAKSAR